MMARARLDCASMMARVMWLLLLDALLLPLGCLGLDDGLGLSGPAMG
jgi:hypothetical protein